MMRTRLVDDADDAQRHPHPPDLNSGRPVFEIGDFAHGVGLGGDFSQALRHPMNAFGGQFQPVEQRRLQTGGATGVHVQLVGRAQARLGRFQRVGDGVQGGILAPRFGLADDARSSAGTLADFGHVAANCIGGVSRYIHRYLTLLVEYQESA